MQTAPTVSINPTTLNIAPVAAANNTGQNLSTITSGPAGTVLAVVGADAGKFEIVGAQLRTRSGVDIVALATYVCNVTSTANGATATSLAFTLNVNTAPGPSGQVTLSQNSYTGSPGVFYVSGALMCHVTAAAGSTLSIIVVSGGSSAGNWTISGTRVTTNSSNFPSTANTHTFRIRATEVGGATFDSTLFTANFTS
jgi:hypothetical protein